jgi:hypothetical protein
MHVAHPCNLKWRYGLAPAALAPTEMHGGHGRRYREPDIASLCRTRSIRPLIVWGGVLVLAFLSTVALAAEPDAEKSRSVLALENAWNQAESRHDGQALKLLLADDFVYTDYDGAFMNRAQWLRKVDGEGKNYKMLANVVQNERVYDDTVVVTGIYIEKLTFKGQEVDRSSRFTDTWIFHSGHWACVASQSTLVLSK